MNLPLHIGWLGALEAGAIAFVIGLLLFGPWHVAARKLHWAEGRAIGWAALTAVALSAGIDTWLLGRLFMVNPGSPSYVQLALVGIHDPGGLGTRVMFEIVGALAGVVVAWSVVESRSVVKKR